MNDIGSQDHAQPYLDMFHKYITDERVVSTFKIEVVIHTVDKDLAFGENIFLHSMVIHRDYENNIGDHIEAQISIPGGTFVDDVFPFLENCEVTLRTKKQYTTGTSKKPFVSTMRYKAVYLKDKNANLPNNKQYSKNDLNQRPPFIVTLQLVDVSVEAMRIKTTSGSFSVTGVKGVKDALATILSSEANKILVNNKPALDFIQIHAPDNPNELPSLTMPSFSRIIEIPDYVQDKSVGFYSSGLGCYIQRCALTPGNVKVGMWVYPLYAGKRPGVETLEIYCPSQEASVVSLPGAIYKDGRYIALAYKPSFQESDKEASVMSSGSGFRSADASKMMDKPVTVTSKGPVFERSKLNTEVIYKERDDGANFAVNKGVYFNTFALASGLMKSKAVFMTLQISNLDHDVIRPGTNVYLSILSILPQNNKVESRKKKAFDCNILQAVFSYTNGNPNPLMSSHSRFTDFTCHASLKLCAEERPDEPKTA